MIGLLTALVLASAQQAPALPFQFDLPEGYGAFEESVEGPGSWISTRKDEGANFRVRHYALNAMGAIPSAVAQKFREDMWAPRLQGIEHSFEAWSGKMDSIDAAGWVITYQHGRNSMTILERIAIQGDSMTTVLWEGPSAGHVSASQYLDAFSIPEAWQALPAPEQDIYRGLGPTANAPMFPGSLELDVFLHSFAVDEYFTVRMTYVPSLAPVASQDFSWILPAGAIEQEQVDNLGGRRVVYRVPLDHASGLGAPYGITRLEGQEFSALNPLWLAMPSPAASMPNVQPPAWKMSITHLANLEALSTSITRKRFDDVNKAIVTEFDGLSAGIAWPFFLIGDYELRQTRSQNWHLRLDSKATLEEDAMLEIMRLRKVLDAWLPRNNTHWEMASFPWIGDRVMPGLLVLDEQREWFSSPVDSKLDGISRRTALARLLCQEPFGARLHGRGSAALFLETSLAEYAAWRLLVAAGNPSDAEALRQSWIRQEQLAGKLPLPLSMLEIGDLYGPRRLLSFGPLVWQSIEAHCGREALDAILREKLAAGNLWSTQDLEVALNQANPDVDWNAFFLKHVYGRHLPTAE